MDSVKIAAVGDILMWANQIRSARMPGNNYSFKYMFDEAVSFLRDADLTIGNLETTFSGKGMHCQYINPKTGWTMFNCPDQLAADLKNCGFDVMITANNHCMDGGIEGLKRTIDILDGADLHHTGTFKDYESSNNKFILDVKGIKIGVLAFTYGTNGNMIPEQEKWAVNLINDSMLETIRSMKGLVDLTIVNLHFGIEFLRQPNIRQRKWTQKCFEYGADIVLGNHPHVIQPMKLKRVRDIDGNVRDRFVIYSLGNFISDRMVKSSYSAQGLILNLTTARTETGEVRITDIEYIPTLSHCKKQDNSARFIVSPVGKCLNAKDSSLSPEELNSFTTAWSDITGLLGGKAK